MRYKIGSYSKVNKRKNSHPSNYETNKWYRNIKEQRKDKIANKRIK